MFQFDIQKDFNYLGQFWYSDCPDKRFPGIFSYSLEKGPMLKMMEIPYFPAEEKKEKTIHGIVEEIGKVTLLGIPLTYKTTFGSDSFNVRNFELILAITGTHSLMTDESFNRISFHFPEIDAFCSFKDINGYFISDNKTLIKNIPIDDDFEIELKQGIRDVVELTSVLPDSIMDKIDPEYKTAKRQLFTKENFDPKKSEFTEQGKILAKKINKTEQDLTITKPFYCVAVKGKNRKIKDFIKIKFELEKLFSVFFLTPIYSDFCCIGDDKGKYYVIKKIGKVSKNSPLFLHLPITINNVKNNFKDIFANWVKILPSDLLNLVVIDKFYNNITPGYQQFSILLAIIGGWQILHGENKDYNKRYENFLKETLQPNDIFYKGKGEKCGNASTKQEGIKDKIDRIFGSEKSFGSIAQDLNNIRDCILHWDQKLQNQKKSDTQLERCKDILNKETSVMNLCEILFIVLLYAIYSKLGIVLSENQKLNLLRYVRSWSECSI